MMLAVFYLILITLTPAIGCMLCRLIEGTRVEQVLIRMLPGGDDS